MAPHSQYSCLRETPWTEVSSSYSPLGSQRVSHDLAAEDEHNINIHILF